jgi:N-acylglucosamine-6-phosphate 2-epimerase
MMNEIFNSLKNGLIVSCQAEVNDPFNSPETLTLFAKAAVMGGAVGIRSEGIEKLKAILAEVKAPVIGLLKSKFEDGFVRITGSFNEVEKLNNIGCRIIAVDGTFRKREGMRGPEFISEIKKKFDCSIMADISTYAEGTACADFGADCVSSTLSGYTPDTKFYPMDKPDFEIIEKLAKDLSIPVIAEGRINRPEYATGMIIRGAWCVVVGSAITRPRIITNWYVDAINTGLQ